jgi:hypothetical protein
MPVFDCKVQDFKLSWWLNVIELQIYINNKFLSLYFYKKMLPMNIKLCQWYNKLYAIFVYIYTPSLNIHFMKSIDTFSANECQWWEGGKEV